MKTFESNYNLCSFKKVISLRRNIQLQSCIVPHYNCHVQNSSKSFSRQKNPKAIKTRDEKKFSNIMGDDFFYFSTFTFLGKLFCIQESFSLISKQTRLSESSLSHQIKKETKKKKKVIPIFIFSSFLSGLFIAVENVSDSLCHIVE